MAGLLALTLVVVPAAGAQEASDARSTRGAAIESPAEPSGEMDPEPEPPAGAFFDTVQVDVVNIDVYVEDEEGEPVRGLTQEEFELYVDGRRVPIASFYAAEDEQVPADTSALRSTGATPQTGTPSTEAPRDQRLYVVFYIDNFNLRPPDRNRVLRRLGRFVTGTVPEGARMMLVTYDHSLHVRQPFTSDPRLILEAAAEAEKLSGLAVSRDADRRLAMDEIEEADDELYALSAAQSFAEQRRTELEAPLEGLERLMEPLGGLDGRVALIHVSSGLPRRVGEDLFVMAANRFPRSHARTLSFRYDMTSTYERLIRAANGSRVSIYALDAGGLQSLGSISAAEGGSLRGGGFFEVDAVHQANLQAPLHRLARETGGLALTNSNNLDLVFDQLAEDLTAYYSLGYDTGGASVGGYHEIEIRVDRPGVKVRYRDGFRALSLERRLEQGVEAMLRLDRESVNPVGLRAITLPGTTTDGDGGVRLDVQIPLSGVTLVPGDGRWRGRLRLAVGAIDAEGNTSPLTRSEPLDLVIPDAQYEEALQQHVTWSATLVADPGRQRVAVGVVDLVSGQLAYTETVTGGGP